MMTDNDVTARIFRYDPTEDQEPRYQEYQIPYQPGMTVVSLLRYVYEELDPTLAFRYYRCGRGFCACCRVKVDGKPRKACATTLDAPCALTIDPVDQSRVIRDIVVAPSS